MPSVTLLPWGLSIPVEPGTTVFAAAARAGIAIPTACNGRATCGLCRVKVIAGEGALPPLSPDEGKHLGNLYFVNKLRLSCRLPVAGDVTVLVPGAPPPDAVT